MERRENARKRKICLGRWKDDWRRMGRGCNQNCYNGKGMLKVLPLSFCSLLIYSFNTADRMPTALQLAQKVLIYLKMSPFSQVVSTLLVELSMLLSSDLINFNFFIASALPPKLYCQNIKVWRKIESRISFWIWKNVLWINGCKIWREFWKRGKFSISNWIISIYCSMTHEKIYKRK